MINPPEIEHPSNIPDGYTLLSSIKNPAKTHKNYLFLKYGGLLVIFLGGEWTNKKTGEVKYSHYQACFPLAALPWVTKMFDYFFTPPKDGGLPAGKISNKEVVEGETLLFNRGMCVGGPNHGGYTLTNLSRIEYDEDPGSKLFQEFDFPDPFLFDGGLLEFWKDLAARYDNGDF